MLVNLNKILEIAEDWKCAIGAFNTPNLECVNAVLDAAEGLDALPALQLQILEACADAVKPGGRLVYATCTVLPAENEGVVRAFLGKHPEFTPDPKADWLPEALRDDLKDGMLTLTPDREDFEGFFIARMVRRRA